jgi:hypothetical protein
MHATETKQESFPTLIAWLSTCLLAAGMGMMADHFTHVLWLQAGSFGLVAAVGLDATARMRWRRQRQKHWRAVEQRWDRRLERFVAQRDVVDELRGAIAQLLSTKPHESRERLSDNEESRFACNLLVEVYAVRRSEGSDGPQPDKVGVIGRLDNLSNSGFGLKLEEQMASRLVIIAVLPPHDQEFDLLGEILWCDPYPDGRMRAGGRLLRILPLGSHASATSPATEADETPADILPAEDVPAEDVPAEDVPADAAS